MPRIVLRASAFIETSADIAMKSLQGIIGVRPSAAPEARIPLADSNGLGSRLFPLSF